MGNLEKGGGGVENELESRRNEMKDAFRVARDQLKQEGFKSARQNLDDVFTSFSKDEQDGLRDLFESMGTVLDEDNSDGSKENESISLRDLIVNEDPHAFILNKLLARVASAEGLSFGEGLSAEEVRNILMNLTPKEIEKWKQNYANSEEKDTGQFSGYPAAIAALRLMGKRIEE